MADISRVFSPVVVLPTGDIRPLSSGRIRSASSKRLPSGNPVESSRVSSAVSTIQNERNVHSQYLNDDIQDSSIIDTEIKQELSTRSLITIRKKYSHSDFLFFPSYI